MGNEKRSFDSGCSESPGIRAAFTTFVRLGLPLCAVCVLVAFAHLPALSRAAVSFDDGQYFLNNTLVQTPSWCSAKRFFAELLHPSTVGGYYQPLNMISLMLDWARGGSQYNLRPFHETSLALHVMNTALIGGLLYLLFQRIWIAAGVALLFGLHPMTVEPIPWVSERKTLVAAFFSLWSLVLYVLYAREGDRRLFAGCFLAYVAALMSKPISTMLPFLLVLLDVWPLNRFTRRTLVEKVPFLVLGAVSGVITLISQKSEAGLGVPVLRSAGFIPILFCHNVMFYLGKIAWPVHLSSHYPFPDPIGLQNPVMVLGVIGTSVLVGLLVLSLRWTRGAAVGWLFFIVAILPTFQFLRFSNVVASDKFAYIPSVGLLLPLTAFLVLCSDRLRSRGGRIASLVLPAILLLVAGAEAMATRRYYECWRDTITHFEHMARFAPNASSLQSGLGDAYMGTGETDRALACYERATELAPYDLDTKYIYARALCHVGQYEEGIALLESVAEILPNSSCVQYDLGNALEEMGKLEEAVEAYERALEIQPDLAGAYNNLGLVFYKRGDVEKAAEHYRRALDIKSDFVAARINLGVALSDEGRLEEAAKEYERALSVMPDDLAALYNLARLLEGQGKQDEAMELCEKIDRIYLEAPVPREATAGPMLRKEHASAPSLER